jgi:hypothetical protein
MDVTSRSIFGEQSNIGSSNGYYKPFHFWGTIQRWFIQWIKHAPNNPILVHPMDITSRSIFGEQ